MGQLFVDRAVDKAEGSVTEAELATPCNFNMSLTGVTYSC